MKTLFVVIILAVLLSAFLAVLQSKGGNRKNRAGAYRSRKLMTDNELEFFHRLVAALPNHYIFPQVAMSALLEASSSDRKLAHSDRLKIAQQRTDYVVCSPDGQLVAVVELDDKTHSHAKDQLRDSRLEQAGIRTVRFHSRNKPTPAAILVAILGPVPAPQEPVASSTSA